MCLDLSHYFDYLKKYTTVLIRKITITNYITNMKFVKQNLNSDILTFDPHAILRKRMHTLTGHATPLTTIGFRVVDGALLIHVLMPAAAALLLVADVLLLQHVLPLLLHALLLQREGSAPL